MLTKTAVENGMAVLIVDTFYNGIASYLEEVEDNCVVIFDEFDKTFGGIKSEEGKAAPEAQMLSLFDGMSAGKKLFVITCNDLGRVNSYLINRPGRFHYHFRFDYPNGDEVVEYLKDKLQEDRYGEIQDVLSFASRVSLNYDCLRAIAFEIECGRSFKDAIKDLNIVNINSEVYTVTAVYDNGFTLCAKKVSIDMFRPDGDYCTVYMYDIHNNNICDIEFNTCDAEYDNDNMCYSIRGEFINEERYSPSRKDNGTFKKSYDAIAGSKIARVIIKREPRKSDIHYVF